MTKGPILVMTRIRKKQPQIRKVFNLGKQGASETLMCATCHVSVLETTNNRATSPLTPSV